MKTLFSSETIGEERRSQMGRGKDDEEIHAAARGGDLKFVESLCSSNPLAVNSRDKHSRTPLHLAAWSGHAQVVDYLCKNKADASAAAMDDMGAIHFAAQKGHLEIVRILLASGVSVKSSTRKGMTALHFAAQGSHLELVKYLVKKGSNTKVKNKAGKTPGDLASNEEVISFLIESESVPNKSSSSVEAKDEIKTKLPSEDQENPIDKGGVGAHGDLENESVERKGAGEDESMKRKGDGEDTENAQGTKKAKVALNHLLSADDAQDEDENL